MSGTKSMFQSIAACVVALLASQAAAAPFSFDDIDFWVGAGANRCGAGHRLVRARPDPPALAWGFRWDGAATGRDMLLAIVEADDRLFAKLGEFNEGASLFGLGYDADDDGQFGVLKINSEGEPVETTFDELGIAVSGIPDADLIRAAATDPGDYYAEGWKSAVWHYGGESETPIGTPANPYDDGSWQDSGSGMLFRSLKNGSWDSWAFELIPPTPPFNTDSYADNPIAAPSPFPPGDFNRDHIVDDADYQLWKSKFGSAIDPETDANDNGVVDAADYTIWRDNFGIGGGSAAAFRSGVPEPSTLGLALCALWQFFTLRRKGRRS